jgi:autotransporter-associated beta strand protein
MSRTVLALLALLTACSGVDVSPVSAIPPPPVDPGFVELVPVPQASFLHRVAYGTPARPDGIAAGAEALLAERLAYLDALQRRAVLRSTALPSGYLNLDAAARGYGAFTGNVIVTLDAAHGGVHARDAWRNDIGGGGKLTLRGSGTLALHGRNSWVGGTQVDGGTLEAASANALGGGDVYIGAGTLAGVARDRLIVQGNYTQLTPGTLALALHGADSGLHVQGVATIAGGTLRLRFADGYRPAPGSRHVVLTAARRHGVYDTIVVEGCQATALYTPTGLTLRIDG